MAASPSRRTIDRRLRPSASTRRSAEPPSSTTFWMGAALALALVGGACCPFPTHPIVPPGPDGGASGPESVGPCDADGGCPTGAYCEPLLTQCSGNPGLAVQIDPGSCYSDNPCNPTCDGVSCGGDIDCGSSMVCESGLCTTPGQSPFGGGPGGSSSGPQPECPAVPSPCPPGCGSFSPIHGCQVCLCATCPWVDAG